MQHKVAALRILPLFFFLLLLVDPASGRSPRVRVACIGNSITYGAGIEHRELNCYPAQLQALLGKGYEVRNFGKNGATVLQRGDIPYVSQTEYKDALQFLPDIVFIELGTNDSKFHNRLGLEAFEHDYAELVNSFCRLSSNPRVVLLLPPPSFAADTIGITNAVIRGRIIPGIRSVAYSAAREVINLFDCFIDRAWLFPDQIHPSSIGAGVIATRLYEVVKLDELEGFDIVANARVEGVKSSYFGYDCYDFMFDGRSAKIVKPRKTAKGCPWLWRARFWGHEPQTEIALLERGFHLVYCDVVEMYGNAEAVGIWNKFYDMLTKAGLARKPALQGFSRGGMYVYRWAAANPDRVGCIYADAPVLDLKSWPGGKGRGDGNPEEWERFKLNFGLGTEEEALAFKGSPLDIAEEIARAGYPILHVCGEADETVPIEENTDPFERKVLAAGGNITVIRKPGIGHHPHSLPNPQPIVDFILRATGQKTNFACVPAAGNEYREGAGWKRGMDWHAVFDEMNRAGESLAGADIIFFGNSITQGIGGKGRSLVHTPGDSVFSTTFDRYQWLNFGVSGDRTQHVLWRVLNGNWEKLKPRLIVLAVGVNNFPDDTGEEVAEGIKGILRAISGKDRNVHVLLAGPLPAKELHSPFRQKFETVHKIISRLDGNDNVHYSGLAYRMLNADGGLHNGFFAPDGIHLTPEGYAAFARLLAEEIGQRRLLE